MLCGEIITVISVQNTQLNTLWGQNIKFLNGKPCDT
jgi:hypothetical protein